MHNKTILAFGSLFICVLGWGFSTNFIEFGLKEIGFLPYIFYRFFTTAVVLTPFVLLFKLNEVKVTVRYPLIWMIGISETVGILFQYFAISFYQVSAGFAALFSLLFVLLVPFLAFLILKEPIRLAHLVAVGIGLVGIVFVSSQGNLNNFFTTSTIGLLLLICTAFGFAFYLIFTAKLQRSQDVDTFTLFYLVMVIICLLGGLAMFSFGAFVLPTTQAWIWILLITFISTIIAFFTYFYAQNQLNPNLVSILLLGQLLIPFTIDIAYVGRSYNIWVYSGIGIIVLSMLVAILVPDNKQKTKSKVKGELVNS